MEITKRAINCLEFMIEGYNTGEKASKTVVGVAASALSIATLGLSKPINEWANLTFEAKNLLPFLFMGALKVINPKSYVQSPTNLNSKMGKNEHEHLNPSGIVVMKTSMPIFNLANEASKNKTSWMQKNLVSRGFYAIGGVVAIVARVADLVLGLYAAVLAVVTLGSQPGINTFVVRELEFFMVIDDVCRGLRGAINPQQFI